MPHPLVRTLCLTLLAALTWLPTTSLAKIRVDLSAEVGYIDTSNLPKAEDHINPIRRKVIEDTAGALGAQGALAWRSVQLNRALALSASNLDHIFDFNRLLIHHSVLPPVITEANNSVNLADTRTLRITDASYEIVQAARFVTTPPTWHDYLDMNFSKPTLSHFSLLPKNQEEAELWNSALADGWAKGLMQANIIFRQNIDRLKRDYHGMAVYRKLLSQHMVSAPFVAKTELGVTGDDNHIREGDAKLQIVEDAKMQTNSHHWKPVIVVAPITKHQPK